MARSGEPAAVAQVTSLGHLFLELRRIDGLIQREIQKARQQHKTNDQFQGLFIAEEEIDLLLAQLGREVEAEKEIVEEKSSTADITPVPRLALLARLFSLTNFELDCILICLAPELDRRYERLYAYLQDDVTKRRPSVDLVLNLLCRTVESKIERRQRFVREAPMIQSKLLHLFEDPSQPHSTLLGSYLKVDERIVTYLLGSDQVDGRLLAYVNRVNPDLEIEDLILPSEIKRRVSVLGQESEPCDLIIYLQGPYGSGKEATAEALSRRLRMPLLTVDGTYLMGLAEAEFRSVVELTTREAMLQGGALYWSGFDKLLAEDKQPLLVSVLRALDSHRGLIFLGGETVWEPRGELKQSTFVRLELPRPTYTERLQLWERVIEQKGELDLSILCTKFRFTAGQIRDAAASARHLAFWRAPQEREISMADLYEACRLQCNRKLSSLARKIKPHYKWDDIILPDDRVKQLREICDSVKYRSLVYENWGFERKLSLGKGLNILFAGPPGTGKTMAAEIMAGELGLDLYKTDLSTVVSKYIGETEKNLARIFAEAETSNAILFFDEADALFGKRSEVRDSHDRYANIEVNYLLQKLEEHEGVVILATNFRKNMDEAFVRRLHFTIDFPFPDESDRRRIWEGIWPEETPRHAELDLQSIARRFEVTGGNIRNIALGAAFLAAENGGVVSMRHLLHATRREYQKMGKVVMHGEFESDSEEDSEL
jgi:SpoVK/Ycf46/Vps4 family AAA+-type ATPase